MTSPQFKDRYAARGRDHASNLVAAVAALPALSTPTLPLTKLHETAHTITLGWPAQGPSCLGFEFMVDGHRSNTWNGQMTHDVFKKGVPIIVTALGANAIGNWPQTPPPPSGLVKGLWDGNGFADMAAEADTGFNTLFTGDASLIPQMKLVGAKACMQSGHWRNEDNTYSVDLATAISWAQPFHDAGLLRQLYLADEPDPVQWPTSPQVIKARYDGLKAAFPDVEMVMGFWDGGDGSMIRPFHDAGCFDVCTLDIYPVNNGGYDATSIPNVGAACASMGAKFYGVAQIFQSGQWQMPSVAQMNRLFDQWEATPQIGMFAYAWGNSDGSTPVSKQFQSYPDLVACVKTRLAALAVKTA